jgi:CRP/FNR family cyclic AMP-dependent transcriptional regulator
LLRSFPAWLRTANGRPATTEPRRVPGPLGAGGVQSVPQRVATALTALAARADTPAGKLRPGARHPQITLTHEQLAALAGTSRETCTKVLHDFVGRGLLRLARGRITVLDSARLLDEAG